MNSNISETFEGYYRSKCRRYDFQFRFVKSGQSFTIFCLRYPKPTHRDQSAHLTHIFGNGKLCLKEGKEPVTLARAQQLAAQWSEYLLEYSRTGVAQH